MKPAIIGLFMAAILSACGTNNNNSPVDNKAGDSATPKAGTLPNAASPQQPVDAVVTSYLQLKNALTEDNAQNAAAAGKQLQEAVGKLDVATLSPEQKKVYDEVKEDMTEHAEHIGSNAGNIAHQREHFDMLSHDLLDLVKSVKPSQALYHDHCPMFNDGKGAVWLSEVKDIKNPYYGKKMPECGEVKEELK